MIPSLYFDYLRSGDARPLKNVFYHNQVDVVSMAALFNHMAGMLADPLSGEVEHGVDLIALAKLNEDLGELEAATRLYLHGLEHDLPHDILIDAFKRLALIYKRRGDFAPAIELWEQAARYEDLDAHVELAKYYEHQTGDIQSAIRWTEAALQVIAAPGYSIFERRHWLPELTHRLERLQRKA
jgi:tetratricopeptide (TPR) repeat protein